MADTSRNEADRGLLVAYDRRLRLEGSFWAFAPRYVIDVLEWLRRCELRYAWQCGDDARLVLQEAVRQGVAGYEEAERYFYWKGAGNEPAGA